MSGKRQPIWAQNDVLYSIKMLNYGEMGSLSATAAQHMAELTEIDGGRERRPITIAKNLPTALKMPPRDISKPEKSPK